MVGVVTIAGTCISSQTVGPSTKLEVKTIIKSLSSILDTAPIRNYSTIKAPLITQDVNQHSLIVAAVLILVEVVRAHNRPSATLLNCSLECRQIDLVECTIANTYIHIVTFELLVIERIVLHARSYAILLHLLNIGNNHLACQVGILTHILKITAIEGSTIDIDTRTEQHSLITIASLLTDSLTIHCSHCGIPRCSQAGQCGECHTMVVSPISTLPLIPEHLLADTMRAISTPHLGNTKARNTRR